MQASTGGTGNRRGSLRRLIKRPDRSMHRLIKGTGCLFSFVHPYPVHLHFRRQAPVVDFSRPASPQRLIQDNIKLLIERPLIGAGIFSPGIRECFPAIDKKIDAAGIPFYSENIELLFIKSSRDKLQRNFLSTGPINIMNVEGMKNNKI